MNEHSIKLLEACSSGSKMALNSLNQLHEYTIDDDLKSVLDTYKRMHEELQDRTMVLLMEVGRCEKEPSLMASTFSYMTAEMKLLIKDDNHQIAKLLMDGCNMGIQSISTYVNDYPDASKEIKDIAEDLVKMEEDFMRDLKTFI